MRRILVFLFSLFVLITFAVVAMAGSSYEQIDQETARQMMEKDDDHIVVDVRRREEYDEGHIPGAILIPNETITSEKPDELPDLDQIILIYCRSGRRSKEAAGKLADMGYTNIYEFGGIIDWTGDIVSGEMTMLIGETEVPVTWEKNASVDELRTLLPLTIEMSMYGGFEQVGSIGQSITSDDQQIVTDYGDVVLYSDDRIVVFYGSNSWAYTRLGHIDLTQKEMTDLLENGNVTITLAED